jgi:hypothetical protein
LLCFAATGSGRRAASPVTGCVTCHDV